jgi:hypothetical protein
VSNKMEATGLPDYLLQLRRENRSLATRLARVRAVIADDWAWSDEAGCRIVEVPDLERAIDGDA